MSSVGSFFSYVNDARSHEPDVHKVCECVLVVTENVRMYYFHSPKPVNPIHTVNNAE